MRRLRKLSWLEAALILAACTLLLQIFFAPLRQWWQAPRPGQLGLAYLSKELHDSCLAPAFTAYLPIAYNQQDLWPLVVFLHGSDVRAYSHQQLLEVSQILTKPNDQETPAVILSPQCKTSCYWQAEDIRKFIELAVQRYRVDEQRVYLMGYSMGGYGVWSCAAADPELYAAAVPIAGGGNAANVSDLSAVPIWAFHGSKDELVPPEESTATIDAIHAVGGTPKLTLYPDLGHGIRSHTCRKPELWNWIFQQNLNNRQPPPTTHAEQSENR